EALRVPDGDVGAELAGRRDESQSERVRGDGDEGAGRVRAFDEGPGVIERAVGRRVLKERAEDRRRKIESLVLAHGHVDAERQGAGPDHRDRLRVAALRDEETVRVAAGEREA